MNNYYPQQVVVDTHGAAFHVADTLDGERLRVVLLYHPIDVETYNRLNDVVDFEASKLVKKDKQGRLTVKVNNLLNFSTTKDYLKFVHWLRPDLAFQDAFGLEELVLPKKFIKKVIHPKASLKSYIRDDALPPIYQDIFNLIKIPVRNIGVYGGGVVLRTKRKYIRE